MHSTVTVGTIICHWKLVDLGEHEDDSRQIPQTMTEIKGKKCFSKDQAFAHRPPEMQGPVSTRAIHLTLSIDSLKAA